MKDTAGKGI